MEKEHAMGAAEQRTLNWGLRWSFSHYRTMGGPTENGDERNGMQILFKLVRLKQISG